MFVYWLRMAVTLLGLQCTFLLAAALVSTTLPLTEQIAVATYVSNDQGGDYNIFRLDMGRSMSVNLTHSPLTDAHPAWSPDGTQIAFVSLRGGTLKNLYLMDEDGRNLRRLTDHDSDVVGYLAWSPDGRKIAYLVAGDPLTDLYIIDVASGEVTGVADEFVTISTPTWSPDSAQLAYGEVGMRGGDIQVYDLQDKTSRLISPSNLAAYYPVWSPTDGLIACIAEGENGQSLMVIDVATRENRRLGSLSQDVWEPAWSPDGKQLAFTADVEGLGAQLYVADVRSGDARAVAGNLNYASRPQWLAQRDAMLFITGLDRSSGMMRFYRIDVATSSVETLAFTGIHSTFQLAVRP